MFKNIGFHAAGDKYCMKVICYHRHIEDWRKKEDFEIISFMLTKNQLEIIKKNKDKWDDFYNVSFFNFRHRIQKIHLESVRNAEMKEIDDFQYLLDVIEDDDFIVPSDDDDWFHPDIKQHLQKLKIENIKTVIAWNFYSLVFGIRGSCGKNYVRERPKADLVSCGYAFTGKSLKEIYNLKGRKFVYEILQYHWVVKRSKFKIKYIEEFLSLYNYHCGSVSQLREKTHRFCPMSSSFAWNLPENQNIFKPYIVDLYRLYEESGFFSHKFI